jgi:integrase
VSVNNGLIDQVIARRPTIRSERRITPKASCERGRYRATGPPRAASAGPRTRWVKAREDALEPLTPHEARHTCASYLIAAGLNPKQVQTYIGHSDVRTTFNVYGHLLPGDEATAAAQLDALLGTALSK